MKSHITFGAILIMPIICSIRNVASTGRIIGGERARKNEFPWLVHLLINETYFCGGALLEWDVILTAAHCVVTEESGIVPANQIIITAGDYILNKPNPFKQTRVGISVVPHPDYNDSLLLHDLALIKTQTPFHVGNLGLIKLPTEEVESTGRTGTVAGWGTLKEADPNFSSWLYKVTIPIVTDHTCTDLISNSTSQFCAGEEGKDSCQGDSGSPLICSDEPTAVCGIVSHGNGCGQPGFPGVYTKVFSFLPWIKKTLGAFSSIKTTTRSPILCPRPKQESESSLASGSTSITETAKNSSISCPTEDKKPESTSSSSSTTLNMKRTEQIVQYMNVILYVLIVDCMIYK